MNDVKRRSGRFWVLLGGGLFFSLVVVLAVFGYALARTFSGGTLAPIGTSSIGVVDVDGVIMDADTLVDQLHKFDDDASIKAIILHIDSPGGGAAPSQEVYNEVHHIRSEKRKPIVASIESLGASGAYYIASGSNTIYANDASVVGSIGVIMEWTEYGDLLKWAKLRPEVLKAGSFKDAGSPTRPLTPEERAYFQGLVDNMHQQFIRDVAAGRGISPAQLAPLATGQVWTGQQALPLHLIDHEGGFRDALLATAKQVGISGEPNVVKPKAKRAGLLSLIGNANDLVRNPAEMLERRPGFYFLWQ